MYTGIIIRVRGTMGVVFAFDSVGFDLFSQNYKLR